MKYIVVNAFKDLEDNEHIYKVGDEYPRAGREIDEISKERIDQLTTTNNKRERVLIIKVEEKIEEPETTEGPKVEEETEEPETTEEPKVEEKIEEPETTEKAKTETTTKTTRKRN